MKSTTNPEVNGGEFSTKSTKLCRSTALTRQLALRELSAGMSRTVYQTSKKKRPQTSITSSVDWQSEFPKKVLNFPKIFFYRQL